MNADFSNPLAVILPYNFNNLQDYPTEVLALRFQAWRSIIKDLVNYLKEYANVQEEIVRQQLRLQQAVGISSGNSGTSNSNNAPSHANHHSSNHNSSHKDDINAINKFFLPIGNGSIQDLPNILTRFHQQNVTNSSKTLKEINQIIIPKLDELRKDLLVKIKEIKNLQNDFKNSLGKEINETKNLLNSYTNAIELSNKLEHGTSPSSSANEHDISKFDPYLVKLKLDRQLKRQLLEENYLYEAYNNLQSAGGKLESIIVIEIQNYLKMFLELINNEHLTIPNFLVPNLSNGFLTKESNFEWDSFISKNLPSPSISLSAVSHNNSNVKNGTFIDLSFGSRKISDLSIPEIDSPLNIALREGWLERRSKFLKSYSSGYYVLTCNFLHEFKTPDRKKDQIPALSLLLDQCHVSEHSKDDGKSNGLYKFVVYTKSPGGIISKGHNLVFRTDTYKQMIDWYNDIKALTNLSTPAARARYVSKNFKHVKKISRNSSIVSSSTNAKSIKSGTTINSRIPNNALTPKQYGNHSNVLNSATTNNGYRSRPVSQSSSTAANNRLSSTFSQRNNNNSPRLANMINSDGTIITPVETYSEYQQQQQQQHQQHHPQQQHTPQDTPQQHHQQQPALEQSKSIPQMGGIAVQIQPNQPQQGYIPTAQSYQYYINHNNENQQTHPQQFYDPVQQQFYTISPSIQPQPQFFQTSPAQAPQRQYIPVNNGEQANNQNQGYTINTANYFPQQYLSAENIPGQLPYPINSQIQPSTSNVPSRPSLVSIENQPQNRDIINGNNQVVNQDGNISKSSINQGEVDTLNSKTINEEVKSIDKTK